MSKPLPEITLTRLSGFDRGKAFRFDESPVVLGTEPTASLQFDPVWDKTVSARHALIEWRGNGWFLKDVSRDGCWINGQRVSGERKLEPSTEMELGKGGPRIRIEFSSEPMSMPVAASPPLPGARKKEVAPKQEAPPVIIAPAGGKFPAKGALIGIAAAVLLLVLGVVLYKVFSAQGTDEQLADIAKAYHDAVGLVVIVTPQGPMPFGTAWAIAPNIYATNSHVSQPVREVLANGGNVFIVVNQHPDKKLTVKKAYVHPEYEKSHLNIEGAQPAVPPFDVGLLVTEEKAPNVFPVADEATLRALRSGTRIAYLGFPMEGLSGGGTDFRNPVATMQSGIVTSLTDWWVSGGDFDKTKLVQHNLGATGGASGSPIFNADGRVIGILSAGNIIGQVQIDEKGEPHVIRAPSAAMINFAQRVDLLNDLLKRGN